MTAKTKTTVSLCAAPFFWLVSFWHQAYHSSNLGLTDDFVRSGINGLNTWDRVENWGNPVGREGRVCLDYKLRSCALPETPWEPISSPHEGRDHMLSCWSCWSLWWVEVFFGIQICKVKKTVRKSFCYNERVIPCNSLMPKQEVLLSIYRGHIHLGCMVLPSLKSIWFVYRSVSCYPKHLEMFAPNIRKYDRFLHKCCQTMRISASDHGTNDFQSLSKRQSAVVFPCGKKLLNGSLGLSRFLFSSTKSHGVFVGCLEISRL